MPEIRTQKELRAAWGVPFCYLCGEPFAEGEERNRDHVPPRSVFAVEDRNPPLQLPVHERCNADQSTDDETLGQLVAVLHGRRPSQERARLVADVFRVGGRPMLGLKDLPLWSQIWRCVRGFHAALYREPVVDRGGLIGPPLPDLQIDEGGPDARAEFNTRLFMTKVFKEQLRAGRTDGLTCNNGRCVYRCVWLTFDNGRPFCLFALRLYNWELLGDPRLGQRGCILLRTPGHRDAGHHGRDRDSQPRAPRPVRPLSPYSFYHFSPTPTPFSGPPRPIPAHPRERLRRGVESRKVAGNAGFPVV